MLNVPCWTSCSAGAKGCGTLLTNVTSRALTVVGVCPGLRYTEVMYQYSAVGTNCWLAEASEIPLIGVIEAAMFCPDGVVAVVEAVTVAMFVFPLVS